MKTVIAATEAELNEIMDFDHVIKVLEDGTVTDNTDEYAPTLVSEVDEFGQCAVVDDADIFEQAHAEGWELLTGFTGQYGYNGPVMHPSEYVGGGLAQHILETPGYYVTLVVEAETSDGEREEEPVGWAVAYKEL